jgi:prophage regulatory protein
MATRFLRLPEVEARVGLSPMTIWRREHCNPPTFPRRVRLGPNAVAWIEEEIEAWCAERAAERDRSPSPAHDALASPES